MNSELLKSLLPLNTERLLIRNTILDDVDILLKMDKQEITQKYLGGIKNKSKEERLTFLKKKIESKVCTLTVCLKDKTPIGFIELNIKDDKAEISYIFDYDFSNKGYCTETVKKLIEVSFEKLKLNEIYAEIKSLNISSKRVLEKLGFKESQKQTKDFRRYSLFNINNN